MSRRVLVAPAPLREIEFTYGPTVTNNSLFGGISDNGVVGVSLLCHTADSAWTARPRLASAAHGRAGRTE